MVHPLDENYRKLPRGRCIQRLMEGAAIRRAVAEKHHGHLVIMKYPVICQCRAYRQIVPAAYNAVGAQHSDGKIRNVHGAASAVAKAGLHTVNLRHHPVNIRALGNAVSIPAVRGFDQIILPQGSANTGGNGLFPNVQMHKSGKLLVQIVPLHAFLKAADQLHRAVSAAAFLLGDLEFPACSSIPFCPYRAVSAFQPTSSSHAGRKKPANSLLKISIVFLGLVCLHDPQIDRIFRILCAGGDQSEIAVVRIIAFFVQGFIRQSGRCPAHSCR